jgi:hypothetical protein
MSEPAFPTIKRSQYFDCPTTDKQGMSLRDYFAAKAMQSIISRADNRFTTTLEFVGGKAYQFADAMMKERDK